MSTATKTLDVTTTCNLPPGEIGGDEPPGGGEAALTSRAGYASVTLRFFTSR